jgi:hypothetical protein
VRIAAPAASRSEMIQNPSAKHIATASGSTIDQGADAFGLATTGDSAAGRAGALTA